MRKIFPALLPCLLIAACDALTPNRGDVEASFSGPLTETYQYGSLTGGPSLSCVVSYDVKGTISVHLDEQQASTTPGTVEVKWSQTISGRTGSGCGNEGNNASVEFSGDLTGTTDDFRFAAERESDVGPLEVRTTLEVTGARTSEGTTALVTLYRSGSGVTGGTTATTMSSSAAWQVALR